MRDKSLESNELIEDIRIDTEQINQYMKKWKYSYQKEQGYVYGCMLYPGIYIWKNDFHIHRIPNEKMDSYPYMKMNYCVQGRCEFSLENNRYAYLEPGMISIDRNQPEGMFISPNGRYEGLEIILNIDILKKHIPDMFSDCGIDILKMYEELQKDGGSYLAGVSEEWQEKAEFLSLQLGGEEGSIEEYRFETLQLLYLLFHGHTKMLAQVCYLTKGQKTIAMEIEAKLLGDLKEKYTVGMLAKEYGVSPSSIEKYFAGVYGTSIAKYIREKRMDYAAQLLLNTNLGIADIAAKVGYCNQGKFGTVFKEHAGATPLEYRRLLH